MHRCSGSSCSCSYGGLFQSQGNSFSKLFSAPNNNNNNNNNSSFDDETVDVYSFMSPSSSSVDCTLSLGTPSTRSSEDDDNKRFRHDQSRSSSGHPCMTNFYWDFMQTNKNLPYYDINNAQQNHKITSRGGNGSSTISSSSSSGNDSLLSRRCANCDTTSTPLWRNGPRGPKSLCNACGIRFKKEERRANGNSSSATAAAAAAVAEQQHGYYYNNSWVQQTQSSQSKMPCYSPAAANEFRFIEDGDQTSDTAIPFLSWRLNVADRPGLVHDFTR